MGHDLLDHPNLPAAALVFFADSHRARILRRVAAHPNCPLDVLSHLACDGDQLTAEAALANPSLTPQQTQDLAEKAWNTRDSWTIRETVLRSGHLSTATLEAICAGRTGRGTEWWDRSLAKLAEEQLRERKATTSPAPATSPTS